VQLFVTAIQNPIVFGVSTIIAGGFVLIFMRAAMSAERRSGSIGWVRAITGPSSRYLFVALAIVWAVGFGLLLPQLPNVAESPYGSLALIALFCGFFIMMGLLWSIIGE
jgi:cellobiose-specific phosphotransferase system component IIC